MPEKLSTIRIAIVMDKAIAAATASSVRTALSGVTKEQAAAMREQTKLAQAEAAGQIKLDDAKKKSAISVGALRTKTAADTAASVAKSKAVEDAATARSVKAEAVAETATIRLGAARRRESNATTAEIARNATRQQKLREDYAAHEYRTGRKSYEDYVTFLQKEEEAEKNSYARRNKLIRTLVSVKNERVSDMAAQKALADRERSEVMSAKRTQDLASRYRYERREIDLAQYKAYLRSEESAEKSSIERRIALAQEQDRIRARPKQSQFMERWGIVSDAASGIASAAQGFQQYIGIVDQVTKKAADLIGMQYRVDLVFGQSAKAISDWAATADKTAGLSKQIALEASGTIGNVMKGAGIDEATRGQLSLELTQRAADIAAFNHVAGGVPEVMQKLITAIEGRGQRFKGFGVYLNEARIEAEAFAEGIAKPTKNAAKIQQAHEALSIAVFKLTAAQKKYGEGSIEAASATKTLESAQSRLEKAEAGSNGKLTTQQRVLTAVNLILKDSADQSGTFAKRSDQAAESQQKLNAQLENMETNLGTKLLPVRKAAISALSDMADWFTRLDTATHGASTSVLGWGLITAPFAAFAVQVIGTIMKMRTAWIELKTAEEGAAAAGLAGGATGGAVRAGVTGAISGTAGAVGGALISTAPITLPLILAAGLVYNVEQQSIASSDQELELGALPARQRQHYLEDQRAKMALSFAPKVDPNEAGGMGASGRAAPSMTAEQRGTLANMDREIALTKIAADRVDQENARRLKAQREAKDKQDAADAAAAKKLAAAGGNGAGTGTGDGSGLYSGADHNRTEAARKRAEAKAVRDALRRKQAWDRAWEQMVRQYDRSDARAVHQRAVIAAQNAKKADELRGIIAGSNAKGDAINQGSIIDVAKSSLDLVGYVDDKKLPDDTNVSDYKSKGADHIASLTKILNDAAKQGHDDQVKSIHDYAKKDVAANSKPTDSKEVRDLRIQAANSEAKTKIDAADRKYQDDLDAIRKKGLEAQKRLNESAEALVASNNAEYNKRQEALGKYLEEEKGVIESQIEEAKTRKDYAAQIALIHQKARVETDSAGLDLAKALTPDAMQGLVTGQGVPTIESDPAIYAAILKARKAREDEVVSIHNVNAAMQKQAKELTELDESLINTVAGETSNYLQRMFDLGASDILGRHRDPHEKGLSGRKLLDQYGASMLQGAERDAFGSLQTNIVRSLRNFLKPGQSQKVGPDGKPLTDAQGNPVMESTPSAASQTWNTIKNSGAGKEISEQAQKAASYLKIGGKESGAAIAEGAATIFTAAQALEAAFNPGKGKKKKYGGLIGSVIGGIAGSFLPGGWKIGSTIGGQIGGQLGFAGGGVPPMGKWVTVGEHGPELARFDSPAKIYSNTDSRAMVANSASGGDNSTRVHVAGPMVSIGTIHDKADGDRVIQQFSDIIDGFTRSHGG